MGGQDLSLASAHLASAQVGLLQQYDTSPDGKLDLEEFNQMISQISHRHKTNVQSDPLEEPSNGVDSPSGARSSKIPRKPRQRSYGRGVAFGPPEGPRRPRQPVRPAAGEESIEADETRMLHRAVSMPAHPVARPLPQAVPLPPLVLPPMCQGLYFANKAPSKKRRAVARRGVDYRSSVSFLPQLKPPAPPVKQRAFLLDATPAGAKKRAPVSVAMQTSAVATVFECAL